MNLLEHEASTSLQTQIDRDQYEDEGLVEVKIPMNLPYLSGWSTFEKYQGETQINGIHYKYVKRKVENGELVLLCILNHEKTLIQSARDDFFEIVNDLQPNSNGKNSNDANSLAKNLLSEYCQQVNNWTLVGFIRGASNHYIFNSSLHSSRHVFIPEQPPEC